MQCASNSVVSNKGSVRTQAPITQLICRHVANDDKVLIDIGDSEFSVQVAAGQWIQRADGELLEKLRLFYKP